MLSDIVVAMLAAEPDIEVVNTAHPTLALESRVDVVILNVDDSARLDLAYSLLAANPRLRIVAIGADGKSTALYDMRPHRTPLGELSAPGLVALVRSAMRPIELERHWLSSAPLS